MNRDRLCVGLVIAVGAAAALGVFISACSELGGAPPHVILISIDTLRHDRMGYAGHAPEGKSTSPFIDRLAEEGAFFSHAVSSATWTLPGHFSMLTGLPSELHEMVDDAVPFDDRIQTLAEFFKEQGYATGGFYSGPYLDKFFGFDQGFDMYEPCMHEQSMYEVMERKGAQLTEKEQGNLVREKERKSHVEITSPEVVRKANYFARLKQEEKLFMFLHFFDVHNDYKPPKPFNKRYDADYRGWVTGDGVVMDPRINRRMEEADLDHLKALYDGEIAWVDHNIEQFFKQLERDRPDVMENCIVVITADHGEEFFEHGYIGHRWNLHGETLRIPLVIWAPNRVPAGGCNDDPVRIYDLYPTILDLAGFPVPEKVFGRSLSKALQGEKLPAEPVISELTYIPADPENKEYHKHYALQLNQYKMIGIEKRRWSRKNRIDFTGDLIENSLELYDVFKDPGERNDLLQVNAKLAEQMLQNYYGELERMQGFHEKIHGTSGRKNATQVPEDIQRKIEGTGYGAGGRRQRGK
jgi:arylsulfatase A-like enzyme